MIFFHDMHIEILVTNINKNRIGEKKHTLFYNLNVKILK